MIRLAQVVLLIALIGCRTESKAFCEAHPGNDGCPGDVMNGGACSGNGDCKDMQFPLCDTAKNDGTCVQCTRDDSHLCTGVTPICVDDQCRGCMQHTDCVNSSACLPDGSCADAAQVAYVDPAGTDNTVCSKMAPCTKVMKALDARRPYIKFHGVTTQEMNINERIVTLLADPDAALDRRMNGATLQITGNSKVEIYDLRISGARGSNNPGISIPTGNNVTLVLTRTTVSGNEGSGVLSTNGQITIEAATLSDNQGMGIDCTGGVLKLSGSKIFNNQGGGISVNGTFDIANNFIYRNVNPSSTKIGGALLIPSGDSHFEFNTVVDNEITDSGLASAGVICDQLNFKIANNIIARNLIAKDASRPNSNNIGICSRLTSAILQDVTALKFASPDSSPFDYHINSDSSAIGQATTPSSVMIDFDNEPRPSSASDQGADQYRPK